MVFPICRWPRTLCFVYEGPDPHSWSHYHFLIDGETSGHIDSFPHFTQMAISCSSLSGIEDIDGREQGIEQAKKNVDEHFELIAPGAFR